MLYHTALPDRLVSLERLVPYNDLNVGKQEILEHPVDGADLDAKPGSGGKNTIARVASRDAREGTGKNKPPPECR